MTANKFCFKIVVLSIEILVSQKHRKKTFEYNNIK